MTFEELLKKIELTISQMESGKLTLDDSLKAYEAGVGLVREAQKRLEVLDGKIEQLLADGSKKSLTPSEGSDVAV